MRQPATVRFILVLAAGAAGLVAQSCSSPPPQMMDYSALETRPSYTDQASRILAENTLKELSQADEDYRLGNVYSGSVWGAGLTFTKMTWNRSSPESRQRSCA